MKDRLAWVFEISSSISNPTPREKNDRNRQQNENKLINLMAAFILSFLLY